jgi:hypothetical protein
MTQDELRAELLKLKPHPTSNSLSREELSKLLIPIAKRWFDNHSHGFMALDETSNTWNLVMCEVVLKPERLQ